MKKQCCLFLFLVEFVFCFFSQTNASVPVSDEIYDFLDIAQIKGLCAPLNSYKPYTKNQVLTALQEIVENEDMMTDFEAEIARHYLLEYESAENKKKNTVLSASLFNNNETFPLSFNYSTGIKALYSGGIYSDSEYDSWGMDNILNINFDGDIGKNLSYRLSAVVDFSKMPLMEVGDYFIGYPWYGIGNSDENLTDYPRYIKRFLNNSYLPYSYKKPWSGQFYYMRNMSASGLEGWATEFGIGFSIDGEIRGSIFGDHIILGAGRFDREVAAMDNGSSLVLNAKAQPFFALDAEFKLFKTLKYYFLTGILEYPNQDYITRSAGFSGMAIPDGVDDSFFFQNAFSLNMIELDIKGFHFDFGSTVIWPKRFELGYLFPLANYVEYQNHIGDFDNLALFGDLKYTIQGIGSVWVSLYLDEINGLNNNPFTASRAMFAYQAGAKYVIPKLPFATVSFRYTKIEPYCYTHHSINYTPWYNHYICENYTNNGESLGYYLPPNSDEFLLMLKIRPTSGISAGLSYQLIRHGADYGSQQVPGSSLYSEMRNNDRDDLKKYFLHDGAYNWSHIVSAGGNISLDTKIPVSFYGNLGFLFSYFTVIDSASHEPDEYGNHTNVSFSTPFSIADNDEYRNLFGAVLTLGVTVSF